MKFLPVFLILSLATRVTAQNNALLRSVYNNMANARTVQYNQETLKFYRNDNYHAADTCLFYLEQGSDFIPRHQVRDLTGNKTYIYNSKQLFTLSRNTRAMDIAPEKDKADLSKNSYWRQSWANLLQMLPAIMQDSVSKIITSSPTRYHVTFQFPGQRLAALRGFTKLHTDTIRWVYEIVIDKKRMLPEAFNVNIQTPSNKEDFIRVNWKDLRTNIAAPKEQSWFSSSYLTEFPNQTVPKKILISKGSAMPAWKLPAYAQPDSVSSDTIHRKLTLLYFWQKNCGICMASFPLLNPLQQHFSDARFRLIAINCYDTREEVGFFHKKYAAAYLMCYNGLPLAEQLGFYGYPMAILIDEKNIVQHVGAFSKTTLENIIREYLNR